MRSPESVSDGHHKDFFHNLGTSRDLKIREKEKCPGSVVKVPDTAWQENRNTRVSQAVTKDLTSSSKFSGSCVLTLQTLPIKEKERERKRLERSVERSDQSLVPQAVNLLLIPFPYPVEPVSDNRSFSEGLTPGASVGKVVSAR